MVAETVRDNPTGGGPIRHILSFDVEHWFDGNLHRRLTYQPERGDGRRDGRLLDETIWLLDLLAQHGVAATFFILGTVADAYPDLARRIAAAGHEVGSHGWTHELVRNQAPRRYLDGLRRSRALLQSLTGQPINGQRAPSWSVDRRVPWAVDALLQAGFTYDSSIFPMRTPLYGQPGFPTTPCWLVAPNGGRLLEWPPAVKRLDPLSRPFGRLSLPFGGGLYWRLLPLPFIQSLLRRADSPVVTYLHPWELNPAPLALPPGLSPVQRLALRHGVQGARRRLATLLETHAFEPFTAAIARLDPADVLPTVSLAGE